MEPVLTADAMREADRLTIETFGLPSFTLMESAGRAAAKRIARFYGPLAGKTVAVLCGKGNNGGDGFVVARVLWAAGARVQVITTGVPEAMTEDAARNWNLLEKLKGHDPEDRLALHAFESLHQLSALSPADLYVDAMLGTGLESDVRGEVAEIVGWLNQRRTLRSERRLSVVALDVPTGLQSDTGQILGEAVEAERTLTMAAPKVGLLLGEGPRVAGTVDVLEIGIPSFALHEALGEKGGAWRATDGDVRAWLPRRAHDAYKYSVGLALVVAGSAGMTGAPTMASLAAARSGAGYVVCACAESLQPTLSVKLTEVTSIALPETSEGGIDTDGAQEALEERLAKAQALLVGPGLGRHPETQRFIRTLLRKTDVPTVIDADGLNALVGHTDVLAELSGGRWVLTPHAGEFKRLAGSDVDLTDRLAVARTYAQRWNSVLVLKGLPSLVGCPDGTVYINRTGGPALATAGTGDVLAGMCTGLMAQGMPPERAAVAALHLGGAAADRYAKHRAARTLLATDLLAELPDVLCERF